MLCQLQILKGATMALCSAPCPEQVPKWPFFVLSTFSPFLPIFYKTLFYIDIGWILLVWHRACG
jgi:hypothetical protein